MIWTLRRLNTLEMECDWFTQNVAKQLGYVEDCYIAEASETSVMFEPFAHPSAGQATGEGQATGIEARGECGRL